MKRDWTSTIYILKEGKVLLIYHRKLLKWLPAGGHIDEGELPTEAAIREAKEETGIDVEIIQQENLWIEQNNAVSFCRPYLCLLENIPAYRDTPAHQHIDFVYVGRPVGGTLTHNIEETEDIRWFSLEELQALEPEVEIFIETLSTIRSIFESEKAAV